MSRLRERHPHVTADEACGLFGFTRQAYYQSFRRGYEASAEIDKTLDAVRRIRNDHPKMGGGPQVEGDARPPLRHRSRPRQAL